MSLPTENDKCQQKALIQQRNFTDSEPPRMEKNAARKASKCFIFLHLLEIVCIVSLVACLVLFYLDYKMQKNPVEAGGENITQEVKSGDCCADMAALLAANSNTTATLAQLLEFKKAVEQKLAELNFLDDDHLKSKIPIQIPLRVAEQPPSSARTAVTPTRLLKDGSLTQQQSTAVEGSGSDDVFIDDFDDVGDDGQVEPRHQMESSGHSSHHHGASNRKCMVHARPVCPSNCYTEVRRDGCMVPICCTNGA
ncbi:uncharacterized protein LOC108672003 [Hyalella azteca]|uniref:Uncharacterized protein LOC108672003 n=1 Tax=Hyalella azteca TaxID=294128 RepID=A0A8B7NN43_HYAAZ|nr:uncharacterized protein LOC108672003 [Hyalella azteca]